VLAQDNEATNEYGFVDPDTLEKEPVNYDQRFDFIFNKGFLVTGATPDSATISSAGSGTYFLGCSFNFLLNRYLSLRLEPGISIFKLVYVTAADQRFPPIPDPMLSRDQIKESKFRFTYAETAAGVGLNINRDLKERVTTYAELGFSAGVLLDGIHKIVADRPSAKSIVLKFQEDANPATFRFGLYGKILYRWVGLWAFYRLTNLFKQNATYLIENDGGIGKFPKIPAFELGICIQL
jgi:hypothetical protein